MLAPSVFDTLTVGMVIGVTTVASGPMATTPATVFTMMTPTAPATWAASTLLSKLHVPRLITATSPATGTVTGVQPLLSGDRMVGGTTTAFAVTSNTCGPKSAVPTARLPTPLTVTSAAPAPVKTYMRMRGRAPSAGVDMSALLVLS